jgi:rare lipoprotein A
VGFVLAVALSGCAGPTAQQHYAHGHEYFSEKKYGHASPKMIADGQPVPKGGGQYLVGHPYNVAGLLVRGRLSRPAHRQRRGL